MCAFTVPMQTAAIAGFKRSGTRDLGQEPGSAFSLVDPVLDQAGGGDVVVLLAELMSGTKFSCELLVVVEKLGQHIYRRDEFRVVVLQPLMLCDVPVRVGRGARLFCERARRYRRSWRRSARPVRQAAGGNRGSASRSCASGSSWSSRRA